MNQTDNKIKFFISTSILTFIGLLNLLMVLFLQFDRYVSIEMASGVIFAVVISLVMSALFVFIKRQWIVWIGIIAAGGIVFWIAREAVMGGTAEFIDAVINDTGIIEYLSIEKRGSLNNLFNKDNETTITFKQIKRIGEDVILVDIMV